MVDLMLKLQEFFAKCSRVWAVMMKPTKDEIKVVAQASGLGILLMGLIGFAISMAIRLTIAKSLFQS